MQYFTTYSLYRSLGTDNPSDMILNVFSMVYHYILAVGQGKDSHIPPKAIDVMPTALALPGLM